MIEVEQLAKHYKVHVRAPGFWNALGSLLHREFRTVKAVDEISFHIPEGEIVGFLGPNGAGKTTTMKLLTGLLHPSSGKLQVAGFRPYEQKNEFKRRISLVMGQKSQLIWDVPAAETFLVNKVIYELDDREYKRHLDGLVEMLKIGEVMTKPVRQLSLGERMKCELAAALLHKPNLVFLDEPTIGLDVNMQEVMRGFIAEYNREFKATILLTSHYMADVTALCERVLVINHGRLVYDGSMSRLVDRFASHKHIALQFAGSAEGVDRGQLEQELGRSGRLTSFDPPKAVLEVQRDEVSELAARLLTKFPVIDLTIEEPSMESIISRAFESAG